MKNFSRQNYVIPEYSCKLNQIIPELEKILPKNDSRFRQDIRLLEEKTKIDEAQIHKMRYEDKQNKELCDEDHKILFITDYFLLKLKINIIFLIENIWNSEKREK